MAVASADRNKVLSITMQAVDKMSPALKAVMATLNTFKRIAVASFNAVTLPVRLLHKAVSALLSPIGLLRSAIAFVAARGFASFFTSAAQAADKIDELSIGLGMSRDALQEWDYVAKLSGSSIESLSNAWTIMADNIASAAEGSGPAVNALRKLGLSARELKALRPEDQFQAIADALDNVAGQAERTQIMRDLFGRGGGELLRILNQGGAALTKMRQEAHRLAILSGEEISNLVKFQDSLDNISIVFGTLRNRIAAQFAPMLERMTSSLVDFVADHLPAIKEGARAVAQHIEFAGSVTIEFVKMLNRLLKDQAATGALGEVIKHLGQLAIDTAEDVASAIIELAVRMMGEMIIPLSTAAIRIGGAIADKLFGGFIRNIKLHLSELGRVILGDPIVADLVGMFTGIDVDQYMLAIHSAFNAISASALPLNEREALSAEFAKAGQDAAIGFRQGWQQVVGLGGDLFARLNENVSIFKSHLEQVAKDNPDVQQFLDQIEQLRQKIYAAAEGLERLKEKQDEVIEKVSKWKELGDQIKGFWGGFKDAAEDAWEAMNDHAARGASAFASIFNTWQSGIDGMIDSAVEGTLNITEAFKQMGKEILKVIAKIIAQEAALAVVRAIFGAPTISVQASALGNVFNRGHMMAFAAGGVVDRPTIFPMARGGVGLMGEAGPEAIMPLRRDRHGRLGVSGGEAGGGTTIINHYHNNVQAIDVQSFQQHLVKQQKTVEGMMVQGMNENASMRSQLKQRAR